MRSKKGQSGFALIVTLIILVVITLIGISAMRLGFFSLAASTNAQANMLLMESATGGVNAVVDEFTADSTAATKTARIVGQALAKPGAEAVRCFNKTDKQENALCDATSAAKAFSGRSSTYVQVAALSPADAAGGNQSSVSFGTDDNAVQVASGYKLVVFSTSALPALGGDSGTKTKACFAKPNDDSDAPSTETVTDCMTNESIPFSTVVQEFCLGFSC